MKILHISVDIMIGWSIVATNLVARVDELHLF